MNARSLVGMTEGAKKRLARALAVVPLHGLQTRATRRRALELYREHGSRLHSAESATLRIGERLRPCPGCHECDEAMAMIDRAAWPPEWIVCDGSGALPARAKQGGRQ